MAGYDAALAAMKKGANHVTHLFNAMPAYGHRDPGVVGAAADAENCMVELICDGIHIHPSVVRNTFRMFGSERVVLISDSMMATGHGKRHLRAGRPGSHHEQPEGNTGKRNDRRLRDQPV